MQEQNEFVEHYPSLSNVSISIIQKHAIKYLAIKKNDPGLYFHTQKLQAIEVLVEELR